MIFRKPFRETLLAGKSTTITDRCNFYVLFVINGADELAVDLGEKTSTRTHHKDIIKENASCKSDKFYNDQEIPISTNLSFHTCLWYFNFCNETQGFFAKILHQ